MIEFEEVVVHDLDQSTEQNGSQLRSGFACGLACENGMCCGLGCGHDVGSFCGTGCS